jgi:2-dehydro-3-deoxyphosphogluconate aldolase/(4S)-4-hydroxy-2-oxoglutarate aldolase
MTQSEIIKGLKIQGYLPLVAKISLIELINVLEAAANAGVKYLEYAARENGSFDVFKAATNHINNNNLPICLGIGSMENVAETAKYHAAGAKFIVCPHIDLEIAHYCVENNLLWIPGAATLTEIKTATNAGAGIVKVFPADCVGGPKFIKAILGPFPNLILMPTGGVKITRVDLEKWFDAGVHCVGIGSSLIEKELLLYPKLIENQLINLNNTLNEIRDGVLV